MERNEAEGIKSWEGRSGRKHEGLERDQAVCCRKVDVKLQLERCGGKIGRIDGSIEQRTEKVKKR